MSADRRSRPLYGIGSKLRCHIYLDYGKDKYQTGIAKSPCKRMTERYLRAKAIWRDVFLIASGAYLFDHYVAGFLVCPHRNTPWAIKVVNSVLCVTLSKIKGF